MMPFNIKVGETIENSVSFLYPCRGAAAISPNIANVGVNSGHGAVATIGTETSLGNLLTCTGGRYIEGIAGDEGMGGGSGSEGNNEVSGHETEKRNDELDKHKDKEKPETEEIKNEINTENDHKTELNNEGEILKNRLENIIKENGGKSFADAEKDPKLKEALMKETRNFVKNDLKSASKVKNGKLNKI